MKTTIRTDSTSSAGADGGEALEDKLTFVLPLATSGTGRDDHDVERMRLLLRSFGRFFQKRYLERFIIVTPARDAHLVESVIRHHEDLHQFDLLTDEIVCPEFVDDPDTSNSWPRPNKGWYRQQLIKLAIHEHVSTRFYMTLDSDVLFVKPFSPQSIITSGRAILNVQERAHYEQIFTEQMAHKEAAVRTHRYEVVEPILGLLRPDKYRGRWYGETPVLLSRDLVGELAEHLEKAWKHPWRRVLLEKLPWTEYALYFLFIEHTGGIDQYYDLGSIDSVLRFSDSLWLPAADYAKPRSFDNWDVERAFDDEREGIAVVVQSYLGYSVADLEAKVAHYIAPKGDEV